MANWRSFHNNITKYRRQYYTIIKTVYNSDEIMTSSQHSFIFFT